MSEDQPVVWCPAEVTIRDDRWGPFVEGCELQAGHPGPHTMARTACDPVAWLSWWDT